MLRHNFAPTLFLFIFTCVFSALLAPIKASEHGDSLVLVVDGKPAGTVTVWLESSLKRVFPKSAPGSTNLSLLVARNSKASFQVCVKSDWTKALPVHCEVTGANGVKATVRAVGLVPLPHLTVYTDAAEIEGREFLPGLIPDPLYSTNYLRIGPDESRSFWVSLQIPSDATQGVNELKVRLKGFGGRQEVELPVKLEISSLIVQPRKNFPITHWWRGEATWDYYKTGMFDERWYQITRWQLADMLEHGSDVIYVPVFMNRHETFKRPCQLLIVNEPVQGKYEFDWSEVKKFTDMCKSIGFKSFEWSHLWIYGGVKRPMPIYKKINGEYVMLWDPNISGFSDTYLGFMKQFLPEFHEFLVKEKLLETSYFHLSDEPGDEALERYKRARQFLRDHAPWMKVMDAMYKVEFAKEAGTDMPIPQLGHAKAYRDQNVPHWVYYCCSPKGAWLNRFLDTPLAKVRMSGWLFYRLEPKGFLHWGFNYWHKMSREEIGDPFHDASNDDWPGIPYGDPFMIYPGPDGKPIDCIRWEVFAESLQDYAILQTAGVKPDSTLLLPLEGYDIFPKNAEWIDDTLKKILKEGAR